MRAQGPTPALALVLGLLLSACQTASTATPGEVVLGASVEQARAHLQAALDNAGSGSWDAAAVHAAHPAEAMPAIDRMLTTANAGAAASLRTSTAAVVGGAQARDLPALRAAVRDADDRLAAVPATVMRADRVADLSYRASVVATLVGAAADEYGEGVEDGRLANAVEYQDASAFLQRARAVWGEIDAAVAAGAPATHDEIAEGLTALGAAMPGFAPPTPPIAAEQVEALAHDVQRELREAIGATAGVATASSGEIAEAAQDLDATIAALRAGDASAAAASFRAFRSGWTRIEDAVRGRDRDAYRHIETDMAAASTALGATPPDAGAAAAAVGRIQETLTPLATSTKTYGAFDAAIILLREGFEALLVVAALLAFMTRSGNADKRTWIWAGVAAGIGGSVVVALLVTLVFSATSAAGADPELLEGITGVVAAAMLLYVSFWLHSRSSLHAWDTWIRDRSASALARNSLLSVAAISFLAVFREGSETVLFYLGVASSIAPADLLLGLAAGTAGLAVIGVAIIGLGLRVPIRPFFLVASILVYYLAFKFVGSGIHALQVAGIVPATPAVGLPDIGLLGIFPTWETTLMQITLLAAAAGVLVLHRAQRDDRREAIA